MENTKYCQSCGMPLSEAESEVIGTNADGSKNEDYCIYCYKDGEYTADMTMDQMIEFCVPYMASNNPGMTEEDSRKMMKEYFPKLKRWQNN